MMSSIFQNWTGSMARLSLGAISIVILVLSGCVFDYPSITEAALVVSGEKVNVKSLYCSATGDVIAVGYTNSLTNHEGVVLHSADRGSTWQRASLEPAAPGIGLSLLRGPGDGDINSLYVSGYPIGRSEISAIFSAITFSDAIHGLQPELWWKSTDRGKSWNQVEARLPIPPTHVFNEFLPRIVTADEVGTLVTAVDELHRPPTLLRSTDGGKSWSKQSLPNLKSSVSIVSDGKGRLALTGESATDSGVIYWSADAGTTWSESSIAYGDSFPFIAEYLGLYRSPSGALIAYNVGVGK